MMTDLAAGSVPDGGQAWLALIGAVLGGSGLKVIEYWLNRSKTKDDSATQFRNELRDEVKGLRDELRQVETELDKWRTKYYELMDEFIKFKQTGEESVDKPAST